MPSPSDSTGAKWALVCIDDDVKHGAMVYSPAGTVLGVVEDYLEMNGNRSAIPRRHLNNNRHADRFAYRKEILYQQAKKAGPVFFRVA